MNAVTLRRIGEDPVADRTSLAGRLILLGTQMLKLAGEVSRRGVPAGDDRAPPLGDVVPDGALLGLLAEEVYRDRRRRARHLPSRLLGEPAWDILLDLYVAAGRGQAVSVSNACLAADAPASTALRWLNHLEGEGLVERLADQTDARRHCVRLTAQGMTRMGAYFAECRADLVGEPEALLASEPAAAE
jgi:DNA-binding MarR family transcriptional regulator